MNLKDVAECQSKSCTQLPAVMGAYKWERDVNILHRPHTSGAYLCSRYLSNYLYRTFCCICNNI